VDQVFHCCQFIAIVVGAGLDLFDRQVSFHGQNPQSVTFDGSLQSQKVF
jgi:hypothetical protein